MKMKPMGDLILLKMDEVQEKTQSGIILQKDSTVFVYGTVKSCGPGLFTAAGKRIPMTTKPGDRVLLHKNETNESKNIILEDETYLIVHESELAMVSLNK